MSAYIVSHETIDVIVAAFVDIYGCDGDFAAPDYEGPVGDIIIPVSTIRDRIGQSLVNQNYRSVNYRYSENTEAPEYHFDAEAAKDALINVEGVDTSVIIGCINCYNYQACETDDYFTAKYESVYQSLCRLKEAMLMRYIYQDPANNATQRSEIPWGI